MASKNVSKQINAAWEPRVRRAAYDFLNVRERDGWQIMNVEPLHFVQGNELSWEVFAQYGIGAKAKKMSTRITGSQVLAYQERALNAKEKKQ